MADIELVIKIPEEDFERCKKKFQMRLNIMAYAIAKGIPLPKGHGDLVDRDAVYHAYDYSDIRYTMLDALEDAPTIIEADKEDE